MGHVFERIDQGRQDQSLSDLLLDSVSILDSELIFRALNPKNPEWSEYIKKGFDTGNGNKFIPLMLEHFYPILDDLIERGMIDTSEPLLDAGSGDSRLVFAASHFGFPYCVGIEINGELYSLGLETLRFGREYSYVNPSRAIILHGSFLDRNTYESSGVEFRNFGTVVSFFNTNHPGLTSKISQESPLGTSYLTFFSGEISNNYKSRIKRVPENLRLVEIGSFSEEVDQRNLGPRERFFFNHFGSRVTSQMTTTYALYKKT